MTADIIRNIESREPIEIIEDKLTLQQNRIHHRFIRRSSVYLWLFFSAFFFLFSAVSYFQEATAVYPALLGAAISMLVLTIAVREQGKKAADLSFKKDTACDSRFYVFEDHIEYLVTKDGKATRFYSIDPADVNFATHHKGLYIFQHEGISFAIAESAIPKSSLLYTLLLSKEKRTFSSPLSTLYTVLLCVTFMIFVLFRIVQAPLLTTLPWLRYALPLLPLGMLATLIIEKIRSKKLHTGRLLLALFLLLACTSISLMSTTETQGEQTDPLAEIEAVVQMDFPPCTDAYADNYKVFEEHTRTYVDVVSETYYFDTSKTSALCAAVEADPTWLASTEETLSAFCNTYASLYENDVFFVYNVTTGRYNAPPETDTVCEYKILIFSAYYPCIEVISFTR